jgi:hypothetical protein
MRTMVSLTAPSRLSTIVPVPNRLLRWAVLIILTAMLGGHVSEMFDRWENTLQTGRDVDYTVVVVAACAGTVFVVAKGLIALFRYSPKQADSPVEQSFSFLQTMFPEISAAGPSPPPLLPLRI